MNESALIEGHGLNNFIEIMVHLHEPLKIMVGFDETVGMHCL